MNNYETERIFRLLKNAVSLFELDLAGIKILTEAASGYYSLTPAVALMAGAEKVFAIGRDSKYGKLKDIEIDIRKMLVHYGLDSSRLEILSERNDRRIAEADIITNLGFVRPLDKNLLEKLKKPAAIPLMWETWEYREEDLDLQECRRLGIPVLGTNESHPFLQTMNYVGLLAMKLMFSLNIEACLVKVVLIGGGKFEEHIKMTLESNGASVSQFTIADASVFKSGEFMDAIASADLIVMAEHNDRRLIMGDGGLIDPALIMKLNPGLALLHIAGGADKESLERNKMKCVPERIAPAGYMSMATDFLGPLPLINLHTAGLRVGRDLYDAVHMGLSAMDAEKQVAATCPFAQNWQH